MSRFVCYSPSKPGIQIAYGLDHVCGWYYQEFDIQDNCLVDDDTLLTKLTKDQLASRLRLTSAPEAHITAIMLDLDPATAE